MPEIPRELIESVVSLLTAERRPIGTAFVVELVEPEYAFERSYYLVTCQHCVELSAIARFHGGATLTLEPAAWRQPSTSDDVVAVDITDFLAGGPEVGCINIGLSVEREDRYFGVGTDLYMLGLLLDEEDIGENIPKARFGNLSAFATARAPCEQGNGALRPSHLADMRSRTGFSGSPVIGYIEVPGLSGHVGYQNRLFGVHSAQHKEQIRLASHDRFLSVDIPSSMTRIVPASVLKSLIETDPVLIEQRFERVRGGPYDADTQANE